MKTPAKRPAQRGISLVQCLVYIAGLLVIGNVATKCLFSVISGTNRNRAVAQDIVSAMNAGERWREDVRSAAGPVRLNGNLLKIPQNEEMIVYEMSGDTLKRRFADGSRNEVVQTDVAASAFVKESRGTLTVWRWELELKPNGRSASMRPLFSFLVVGKGDSQ